MAIYTLQDSTRPKRRHVNFDDRVVSSGESSQLEEDNEIAPPLIHAANSSSSSDDEEPYKLSARTKQTAHKSQSSESEEGSHADSEGSHDDSPSGYLDLEAEEVWQSSNEDHGSSDMDDFIDDLEEAGSGSCDIESCDLSEASKKEVGMALPVPQQRCHMRRLLDSSSSEGKQYDLSLCSWLVIDLLYLLYGIVAY